MEFHPFANLFPLIEGADFSELVADIAANGLREPIVLLDGRILDGRNRYRACVAAGVDPITVDYAGDDPIAFVVSLNLRRRHLDEGQRAWVAAQIAKLPKGRPSVENPQICGFNQPEAAALLNVSERTVQNAAVVRDHGVLELQAKVAAGAVAPSTAADVARLPAEEQREIVARGEREILEAAKRIRGERAVAQRESRLKRIAEISRGNAELGTAVRYPIIYADPPWRYENAPMGSESRAIENHYPTMSLDEICALPVADLATDDAMLYLWATAPKLAECMRVIEAWGFEYRTNLVWDKEVIGMGYHARNQHEILLIAKRGDIPPPEPGKQPSSVHRERRGEHSAKPDHYYEMIEAAYPELPKVELFARRAREGWALWGNQSPTATAATTDRMSGELL